MDPVGQGMIKTESPQKTGSPGRTNLCMPVKPVALLLIRHRLSAVMQQNRKAQLRV